MSNKVIMIATKFMQGHERAGQETQFIEKISNSLYGPRHMATVTDEKHHTFREGFRFKKGDTATLKYWTDKPYRSKQEVAFSDVVIHEAYDIIMDPERIQLCGYNIEDVGQAAKLISLFALNDGLTTRDFFHWFEAGIKKVWAGQIVVWNLNELTNYEKNITQFL